MSGARPFAQMSLGEAEIEFARIVHNVKRPADSSVGTLKMHVDYDMPDDEIRISPKTHALILKTSWEYGEWIHLVREVVERAERVAEARAKGEA